MLRLLAIISAICPLEQPSLLSQAPTEQKAAEQKAAEQKPIKPSEGQDKEKAAEPKPTEEPQAEPKAERFSPGSITLGFSQWNLRGNESQFRQFGTPPRSLFVGELLLAPKPSLSDTGYFISKGVGESDYRHDARLALFNGRTQAEAWLWRSEFFDPIPSTIPGSRRSVEEDSIKQMLTRDFSVSMRYRMINQNQFYEPPLDPLHQRTRYWDTIASGRLGNGQVRLGYTDWRYFDRTGTLLDTQVSGWRLGYMWTPLRDLGLEAAYSSMRVKQSGQPTGRVDYISLSGDAPIGNATDLGVLFRRDRLKLPAVRTAYAREQRLAQIGLAHSWNKWNARVSLSQRDVERVRGDQTFVDVPQWTTFEGRIDGRLQKNLRLMLRGYTQSVSSLPPMVTDDPRSLYWNSRQFVQMRLQHTNGEVGSYLVWTHRNWDNDARAVNLNLNSFVLGGNWQAGPRVSVFAEYTKENWNGRSEITTFPTLRNFLPDSHVIAAGLDWMIHNRAFVSINVTNFGTNNENPLVIRDGNTSGIFVSINTRYVLPSGEELGLTIAPWTYRDDVRSVMNYDAAVVMLTGKVKF